MLHYGSLWHDSARNLEFLLEERHVANECMINETIFGVCFLSQLNHCQMCQGLNSHYFHIIGDGHQPNSRGLYTHYKDSY